METLTRPGEHAPTNPPAVAFSSVMGICGLGLSWRAAGQVLAAPHAIGEWLIAVGVMLFIALSALYGIKTVREGEEHVTVSLRVSSRLVLHPHARAFDAGSSVTEDHRSGEAWS